VGRRSGRQDEQTGDASALRAEEGRRMPTISVGEPDAGRDPAISEWGNLPTTVGTGFAGGNPGN